MPPIGSLPPVATTALEATKLPPLFAPPDTAPHAADGSMQKRITALMPRHDHTTAAQRATLIQVLMHLNHGDTAIAACPVSDGQGGTQMFELKKKQLRSLRNPLNALRPGAVDKAELQLEKTVLQMLEATGPKGAAFAKEYRSLAGPGGASRLSLDFNKFDTTGKCRKLCAQAVNPEIKFPAGEINDCHLIVSRTRNPSGATTETVIGTAPIGAVKPGLQADYALPPTYEGPYIFTGATTSR